jgi:hypothetical protein
VGFGLRASQAKQRKLDVRFWVLDGCLCGMLLFKFDLVELHEWLLVSYDQVANGIHRVMK